MIPPRLDFGPRRTDIRLDAEHPKEWAMQRVAVLSILLLVAAGWTVAATSEMKPFVGTWSVDFDRSDTQRIRRKELGMGVGSLIRD